MFVSVLLLFRSSVILINLFLILYLSLMYSLLDDSADDYKIFKLQVILTNVDFRTLYNHNQGSMVE
jgi:hypothetical protein